MKVEKFDIFDTFSDSLRPSSSENPFPSYQRFLSNHRLKFCLMFTFPARKFKLNVKTFQSVFNFKCSRKQSCMAEQNLDEKDESMKMQNCVHCLETLFVILSSSRILHPTYRLSKEIAQSDNGCMTKQAQLRLCQLGPGTVFAL